MVESAHNKEKTEFLEESSTLWLITLAPTVWALHFLVSYATVAIACEKLGSPALPSVRIGLGFATAIALALIAVIAWRSWRQWDFLDDYDHVHEEATGEHRHEFLGHAAFLLSVLAGVGVLYCSLPVLLIDSCR